MSWAVLLQEITESCFYPASQNTTGMPVGIHFKSGAKISALSVPQYQGMGWICTELAGLTQAVNGYIVTQLFI